MLAVLVVFAATLAYAVIDLVRRRRHARAFRRVEAGRRDSTPRPRLPDAHQKWFEGAKLDGGYVVGALLGSGAFGDVHLVENRALDRRWAVKVIRRDLVATPVRRQTLLRELAHGFRVAGHPHIVRTEMFRSFGDEIAIFSELVEGGSLASALSSPRLATIEGVLDVALQLAWALEALHLAGLVHGDVKPGNVLLTAAGAAKLADLGLASFSHSGELAVAVGTPLYRSPEQARGNVVTAASDVWGWAATVIAMLLGEPPSHAGGEVAAHTLASLRTRRSPARVAVDDQLYHLLSACLRKDPKQRTSSSAISDELSARLGRMGQVPVRTVVPSTAAPAPIADELAAHAEALRLLLIETPRGNLAVHDAALCCGMAKAGCHRCHGDLAGAATTLETVLGTTSAATPRLRASAWLELGFVHHDRGAPSASIHAFDQAAATIDDPGLRARAHQGAAAAAWAANEREAACTRAQRAVVLAAHAIDVATIERNEARELHAVTLITLSYMLRELGDTRGYEACVAHAITACGALDDAGRQTLVRGLVLRGDFAAARARLDVLDRRARSGDDAAPGSRIGDLTTKLLAATIDLEEARALALDGRLLEAVMCARCAWGMLRPLANRGVATAALPLAVTEIYLAWLLRRLHAPADTSIEGALTTLDDAARRGRRDAAALAQWAREQQLATRS